MRLLDTQTGQFVEKDPVRDKIQYAILSHTWDSSGEQTYQDLREIQNRAQECHPQLEPDTRQRSAELMGKRGKKRMDRTGTVVIAPVKPHDKRGGHDQERDGDQAPAGTGHGPQPREDGERHHGEPDGGVEQRRHRQPGDHVLRHDVVRRPSILSGKE